MIRMIIYVCQSYTYAIFFLSFDLSSKIFNKLRLNKLIILFWKKEKQINCLQH